MWKRGSDSASIRTSAPCRTYATAMAASAADGGQRQALGDELADAGARDSRRATGASAISGLRAAPRASSRLARFAHAINSSTPTAASSAVSDWENSWRVGDAPRAPGRSWRR